MTPRETSAILWLLWSICVCVFAVLLATHMGAFDIAKPASVSADSTPQTETPSDPNVTISTNETVYDIGYGVSVNESTYKKIQCNYRFFILCEGL